MGRRHHVDGVDLHEAEGADGVADMAGGRSGRARLGEPLGGEGDPARLIDGQVVEIKAHSAFPGTGNCTKLIGIAATA